jgi:hypothetical protein
MCREIVAHPVVAPHDYERPELLPVLRHTSTVATACSA